MRRLGLVRPKLRRRGAPAEAGGETFGPSWLAYRRRDTGGVLVLDDTGTADPTSIAATPLYVAGLMRPTTVQYSGITLATGLQTATGSLADQLVCMPEPLPAGKVVRLVWACTGNAPASGNIRMGVYACLHGDTSNNLYPGALLYDSGAVSFAGLGHKTAGAISGGGLSLDAGLYFFVLTADTDAVAGTSGGPGFSDTVAFPIGGCTVRWGNGEPVEHDSLLIGWAHAQSFGALPDPFPISAPRRMFGLAGNPTVPAIFYGYDPDEGRV